MVVEGYVKPNAQTLDESLYGNDYFFCHFEVNFVSPSFHIGDLMTLAHILYTIALYHTIQVQE